MRRGIVSSILKHTHVALLQPLRYAAETSEGKLARSWRKILWSGFIPCDTCITVCVNNDTADCSLHLVSNCIATACLPSVHFVVPAGTYHYSMTLEGGNVVLFIDYVGKAIRSKNMLDKYMINIR